MEVRICKYCNKEFNYTTHGKEVDAKRGHFCGRDCYNLSVQYNKLNSLPNVEYLKSVLTSLEGTVTLSVLSEKTNFSKNRIRSAIRCDYKEWHISIKGYYKQDFSIRTSDKYKSKNKRIKECIYCGNLFEGHYNRKFCRMRCKDAFDTRKIIRADTCYVCGNHTDVTRGKQNSIPLCSDMCRAKLLNKGIKAQQLFDLMERLGITGTKEYMEDDLRNDITGAMLRIDFYSKEFNLAVEYHGEQHYAPKPYFDRGETLKDRQYRDQLKQNYIKSKGIDLVIWKYDMPVTEENVRKIFAKYIH